MLCLFILGRNPPLSLEEIKSYFARENNKILSQTLDQNALFLELEKPIGKIIDKFGGVISIGEVLEQGSLNNIIKVLDKKMIYFGESNKLVYVIWNFTEDNSYNQISDYLKQRFRSEKLKATEKNLTGTLKLQSGEEVKNVSSNLIDEEFFIFGDKKNLYFGKITQKSDYESIEKRDMQKPVRREALSISPRLAKIMINLSQVRENEALVDPFCGIGVVLQEALLQNIKVIGIDRDKSAIEGARKNFAWFKFSLNNYQLINSNSSREKIKNANGLATEPDFGEILKKLPTKDQANKTLRNFENLMISVINNLKSQISGKIVFTAPLIKTMDGRISCNSQKISQMTGLKLANGFPIDEFREEQIVGRQIVVLER